MKKLYTTALLALFIATFAHGDLIQAIGNLTTSDSTSTIDFSDTDYVAGAFHTGTHPTDIKWSNFTLTLKVSTGGSWPASGVLELWHANTNGIPTTIAKSYDLPATRPSDGLVTVGSPNAYSLYEDRDYAIVIHADMGEGGGFVVVTQHTTDDDPGTAPGWVLGKSVTTSSNGGAWEDHLTNRLQMAINVDTIPEPATLSLIALIGGGIILGRRIFRI